MYSVGLLGVTGERVRLAATATALAGRLLRITDKPVLVGVGVSNAEQAREACAVADGVVQGASVVRRLIENGPDAVGDLRRRGARRDRLVKPVGRRARAGAAGYRVPISTAELVAGTATSAEPSRADDDTSRRAIDSIATRRRVPTAVIGLIGVVIAFVGITAMFSFEQAPFYDSDEKAHLGYAHEIAEFRLPEIDRQPAVPDSARQWQTERATARTARHAGVWVANHPPLHYVLTAPLIWFAEATDRPDGGLLLMRLANTALAADRGLFHVPAGNGTGRR